MPKKAKTALIVCTEYKGIFFGYCDESKTDLDSDTITLENVRNCVSFNSSIRGFGGLAEGGPDRNCRIGAQMPRMQIRKVTAVIWPSKEAVKAWESAPWN